MFLRICGCSLPQWKWLWQWYKTTLEMQSRNTYAAKKSSCLLSASSHSSVGCPTSHKLVFFPSQNLFSPRMECGCGVMCDLYVCVCVYVGVCMWVCGCDVWSLSMCVCGCVCMWLWCVVSMCVCVYVGVMCGLCVCVCVFVCGCDACVHVTFFK